MHKLRAGLLALLCLGAGAGCSTQTSPGDIITGPVALLMSVGTVNDSAGSLAGIFGAGAGTYLNVVATFRNNVGASAFIAPGNANLKGPGALKIALGGIFSYGQAPGSNGVLGMSPGYNPPSTAGGYSTGFIDADGTETFLGLPPTPGTYALAEVVTVNGQNQPYGASATLPGSPKVLPADPTPGYVSGGANGSGTFTISVPAGVTQTVVAVYCASITGASPPSDPCIDPNTGLVAAGLQIASGVAKGAQTNINLPAGTLVQGDGYTAFAVGADYPLVDAGPPVSVAQKPTLTGASGTSNLTVSGTLSFTQ